MISSRDNRDSQLSVRVYDRGFSFKYPLFLLRGRLNESVLLLDGIRRRDASQKQRKHSETITRKVSGTVDRVTLPASFLVKWTVSSVAVTPNAAADKKNIVANLIMAFIDTKTQI